MARRTVPDTTEIDGDIGRRQETSSKRQVPDTRTRDVSSPAVVSSFSASSFLTCYLLLATCYLILPPCTTISLLLFVTVSLRHKPNSRNSCASRPSPLPDSTPTEVRRSATRITELLEESGFSGVRLLEIEGAHPAVYAEIPAPDGAPTVLLYAHHDVQPPGPAEEWESSPFEPIIRDGRILGRGAADDKAGVVMHLAAVRAFGGNVPVGVKVFMEGEEEIGSANLGAFLATYRDLLEADVIVIGDAGNWAVGTPALTTSLRGLVDCVVEVRTLEGAVHSGMFGGAVPDAIIALARVISSLHNDDGSVAIQGPRRSSKRRPRPHRSRGPRTGGYRRRSPTDRRGKLHRAPLVQAGDLRSRDRCSTHQ